MQKVKTKLKVGDPVKVLIGKFKGKTGAITAFSKDNLLAKVEGVGIRKKAVKPSQMNPKGGFSEVQHFIHVSNIAYYADESISKLAYDFVEGKKVRKLKKTNKIIK